MATLTQVEDAVAALLGALGRELVQGRIGEAPSPAEPYALWSLDRLTLSDFPVKSFGDVNQVIVSTNTPLEFLIDLVGGPAMADAVRFGLSLRQTQRTADLYKLCGLSGITSPQNLSAVEVGTYRQRVQLRLTLFTAVELTAPVEYIDTICVNVKSQEPEFDEQYCMTRGECH